MHKDYVSDKPGNCPICSMKLVKKEDAQSTKAAQAETRPMQTAQTTMQEKPVVYISPERQQTIGVRSVAVKRKMISRAIRAVGRVAYDETRLTHVHTRVTGWIQDVFVNFVGARVRKGQPLFTLYSPEIVSTQEEYLLALQSKEDLGKSSYDWIAKGSESLADSSLQRLKLWDVSDAEIGEIEKTGKPKRALNVYSPVSGIVLERSAYHHGTYVTPEMELYKIVDLSTVWVVADIYEKDFPLIRTGQTAMIQLPYASGAKSWEGEINFFYPTVDPKTRTGQIRIVVPNRENQLKPDQYLNVIVQADQTEQLVVPPDAVLNTGEKQYVFVDLGNGYFEPRPVRTGLETPEDVAIEEGLNEGDRVVTAANFILDSESRLKGVFENMGKPSSPTPTVRASEENLSIELLEPRTGKSGDNDFRVAVKDRSGNPVTGAEVEVTLSMPAMGSMPPMSSKDVLLDQGEGIYEGVVQIPMAWTWDTLITVRKSGQVIGTFRTSVTAR